MGEATAYYERRETELGAELMREVERQVMLRIIDQRWREHLYEMDYLMEGINLRAMGQQDPLVAWQQDGFKMFGQMMHGIAQDFVRYVMHVQVVQQEQTPAPGRAERPDALGRRRRRRAPPPCSRRRWAAAEENGGPSAPRRPPSRHRCSRS